MTVVLVAEGGTEEFGLLSEAIERRGGDPVLWDTTDWPSEVPLTYDVGSESVAVEREFRVEEVTGAFPWADHIFRPFQSRFVDQFDTHGVEHLSFKLDQWRGVFNSILARFEHQGATVFYPPWSQYYHDTKPLQLAQFESVGVSVPDTLFSTDPSGVREFVAEHGEVVYKPIVGGTRPSRLSEAELDEVPLEQLSNAPVQFQEYVPGDDVRVFFLDGEVVGASRYVTDDWSFKTEGPTEDAERVDLRMEVREDLKRAARVSPMRFGAADLRISGETHALLEVNPYPRFAFHDRNGATDIAGVLAEHLVK